VWISRLFTSWYDRMKSHTARKIGGVKEFVRANEVSYRIRPIDR